jgi:hypothetical protein
MLDEKFRLETRLDESRQTALDRIGDGSPLIVARPKVVRENDGDVVARPSGHQG